MKKGKVFVGSPIRNRGWVFERHIKALLEQTDVEMEFCYVLNDSTDNTQELLDKYGINYVTHNLGGHTGHVRGKYSYDSLAKLRNRLIEEFLNSDCNYLFSIDSDIIIPKGSLGKLIDNDKDICSMLLRNHPHIKAHNVMSNGRHLKYIPHGLIECDLTGAVYLIKRKVIESGVRYANNRNGEDVPFCSNAKRLGFKLYCDTTLTPIHAYTEEVDLVATADFK